MEALNSLVGVLCLHLHHHHHHCQYYQKPWNQTVSTRARRSAFPLAVADVRFISRNPVGSCTADHGWREQGVFCIPSGLESGPGMERQARGERSLHVFLWVWDRGRRLESDMFAAVAPFSLRFTWQGSDETLDVGSLFITEGPASVSCVQSESGPTP